MHCSHDWILGMDNLKVFMPLQPGEIEPLLPREIKGVWKGSHPVRMIPDPGDFGVGTPDQIQQEAEKAIFDPNSEDDK
jgi:hypothetical protein